MSEFYLGLISGTSMDGVDAVVAEFTEADEQRRCKLHATGCFPYDARLARALERAVSEPGSCDMDTLGILDVQVGRAFAEAALELLDAADLAPADVEAIGSHGQTIRHQPDEAIPFTLQIGDPNMIAALTACTTVADFRRGDLAHGGQGAPLAPAFHGWLFGHADHRRAVVNLGGIANITLLESDVLLGFDSGPANTLMDLWTRKHRRQAFDRDGRFAAEGKIHDELLSACLRDPYFSRPPPKSTGREYFNGKWLDDKLRSLTAPPAPADVQATLLEVTARTIADAIHEHARACERVLVCGGGSHNRQLTARLGTLVQPAELASTSASGLHPDWVEATAFAWLARETLEGRPGSRTAVTGARQSAVLGGIYRTG